jgi:hypothetical protein
MPPRAMPPDTVMVLRVVGGDPMPTSGAMVNTRRRWHFCHRWWRRHRRDIGRWRRARRRRWRRGNAGRQAEDRQCDQDGHNRGFHIAEPFIFRRANGVRWPTLLRIIYAQVEPMSRAGQPTVAEECTHAACAPHTRPHHNPERAKPPSSIPGRAGLAFFLLTIPASCRLPYWPSASSFGSLA